MKYCNQCGNKLEDKDTFCSKCGNRVNNDKLSSSDLSTTYVEHENGVVNNTYEFLTGAEQAKVDAKKSRFKKLKKIPKIIFVLMTSLGSLGCLVGFILIFLNFSDAFFNNSLEFNFTGFIVIGVSIAVIFISDILLFGIAAFSEK